MKKTREAVLNFNDILDFIWPRECAICARPVDRRGRHLCADCLNRLPALPTNGCCRRCGRAAEGLDGEFLCQDCRTHHPAFDRAASAFHFEGEARKLVLNYKFHHAFYLLSDFVDWLEATARARLKLDQIDLIVPIPLVWWHRLDRGFNQCAMLANHLAHRLNLPCDSRALRRTGLPHRQLGLTADERRQNVIGTFAVRHPKSVADKTVLLVDDVMTTGATLSEAAATLKHSGTKRVMALTIAHSIR